MLQDEFHSAKAGSEVEMLPPWQCRWRVGASHCQGGWEQEYDQHILISSAALISGIQVKPSLVLVVVLTQIPEDSFVQQ